MAYLDEKALRAHIDLIENDDDYRAYFNQGASGAWLLTNASDKAAVDALLNAKIASDEVELGAEEPNGSGPSDFDEYEVIHFDDDVEGASYRAWFIKDGAYFKADNGDSSTLTEITDADEIATLLADSEYQPG